MALLIQAILKYYELWASIALTNLQQHCREFDVFVGVGGHKSVTSTWNRKFRADHVKVFCLDGVRFW